MSYLLLLRSCSIPIVLSSNQHSFHLYVFPLAAMLMSSDNVPIFMSLCPLLDAFILTSCPYPKRLLLISSYTRHSFSYSLCVFPGASTLVSSSNASIPMFCPFLRMHLFMSCPPIQHPSLLMMHLFPGPLQTYPSECILLVHRDPSLCIHPSFGPLSNPFIFSSGIHPCVCPVLKHFPPHLHPYVDATSGRPSSCRPFRSYALSSIQHSHLFRPFQATVAVPPCCLLTPVVRFSPSAIPSCPNGRARLVRPL